MAGDEREQEAPGRAPPPGRAALPAGRISAASIAAAVGNAAFADAARPGRIPPDVLASLIRGGQVGGGAVARSAQQPALLRSLWQGVAMPGTDAGLATRLERAVVARAPLSRDPGRCACGGVPEAGGECAECRGRRVTGAAPQVAREPNGPEGQTPESILESDPRLQDPGFLICTAFCFLGIPPSLFKDVIAAMLEAAYKHFEAEDPSTCREKFATHHAALSGYGKIKILGLGFRFLMAGELWFGITIKAAAATAVRQRVIAMLIGRGLRLGSLVAAEAIVRRVLLYINLAIAANCGAYCGADQAVKAALEITEGSSRALSEGLLVLQGVGSGVGQVVSAMLANAYGQLDPANWKVGGLQGSASADLQALGMSLFAQVRPASPWRQRTPDQSEADAFVANASKPISSFTTPYVQQTLLPSIAKASQTAMGGQSGQQLTGTMLAAMSPLGLISFLRENGFVSFVQDPIAYANAALASPPPAAPAAPAPAGAGAP